MHDYPKNLIIEHRSEPGKDEVTLKMSAKKQEEVGDLVNKRDNQMSSNVGKNLVAK